MLQRQLTDVAASLRASTRLMFLPTRIKGEKHVYLWGEQS